MSADLNAKSIPGVDQFQKMSTVLNSSSAIPDITTCLSHEMELATTVGSIQKPYGSNTQHKESDSIDDMQASAEHLKKKEQLEKRSKSMPEACEDNTASLECLPNADVFLMEARASSPESVSSVNELSLLAPDSPVPHFRPLSPLPPPFIPVMCSPVFLTSESEERPLTPMISNKRPFGQPVSPGSDYSSERSVSPQWLTFDIDNRALSPESVILETTYLPSDDLCGTPETYEIKSSESLESLHSSSQFQTDSPVPQFTQFTSAHFTSCKFRSPQSKHLYFEENTSPGSSFSMKEHQPLLLDSPVPAFSTIILDATHLFSSNGSSSSESGCSELEHSSGSLVSFDPEERVSSPSSGLSAETDLPLFDSKLFDYSPTPENILPVSVEVISESDDEWIRISLNESALLSGSETSCRPMTPQSKELDMDAHQSNHSVVPESGPSDTNHADKYYSLKQMQAKIIVEEPHPKSLELKLETANVKKANLDSLKREDANPERYDNTNESQILTADSYQEPKEHLHCLLKAGKSQENRSSSQKQRIENIKKKGTDRNDKEEIFTKTSDLYSPSLSPSPELVSENLGFLLPISKDMYEGQQLPGKASALELQQQSSPLAHSSAVKADQWKFISHIHDPQYVTKTTVTKTSRLPFPKECHASESEESVTVLSQRSFPTDSGEECGLTTSDRPQDKSRLDSSQSGTVEDGQQASTADSPIYQYIPLLSAPLPVPLRTVSPECFPSDPGLETDLDGSVHLECRDSSPASMSTVSINRALSPDSPVPRFEYYLPESGLGSTSNWFSSSKKVSSECKSDLFAPLFIESKTASTDSGDENSLLSPDSPIPDFELEGHLQNPSVSYASDLDWTSSSLAVCSEQRASSPDSLLSKGDCGVDSPIPDFSAGLVEFVSINKQQSSISGITDVDHTKSDFISVDSQQRSESPESRVFESLHKQLDHVVNKGQPLKVTKVPVYKLVYDAELWKLISQIRDPHYVGETFFSKTGGLKFVGTRTECLSNDSDFSKREPPALLRVDTADLKSTGLEDREGASQLESRPPSAKELLSRVDYSSVCLQPLKGVYRDLEIPQRFRDPDNFSQTNPSSQDLTVSDEKTKLYLFSNFTENRPASPCSAISLDENSPVTPDSPFLDFQPVQSEFIRDGCGFESEPAALDVVINQRRDSPESACFADIEYRDDSDTSDLDEYRPQSPDSVSSYGAQEKNSQKSPCIIGREFERFPSFLGFCAGFPKPVPFDVDDASSVKFSPNSGKLSSTLHSLKPEMKDIPLLADSESKGLINEFKGLPLDAPFAEFRKVATDSKRTCSKDQFPSSQSDLKVEQKYMTLLKNHPSNISDLADLHLSDVSLDLLLDNRAATKDELRALSPDSPVPQFTAGLQESFLSHSASRSTSTESLFSGSEMELSFLLSMEDRPQSPDSLPSNTRFRNLSPDSPVLDFRPHLLPAESDLSGHRSCSPELDFSDSEHVPLISDIFMFEDRAESCQSGLSGLECRALFLDSPIPYYPMPLHFEGPVKVRSTSPESLLSEEDLDHSDLSLEWLFDNRASSPDSAATKDELRALSPDSPVPQFTAGLQESFLSHSASRSTSTESLFSGSEMELSFLLSMEDRPQSPDSLPSNTRFRNLSPDSPVLDFRPHLLPAESDLSGHRSCSPELDFSDSEHVPLISDIFMFEDRAESCQSGLSGLECRALFLDSPIPYYPMPLHFEGPVKVRSTSPESLLSEEDLDHSDLSLEWLFDNRASSPDSAATKDELRALSPDSPVPQFTAGLQESFLSHSASRSTSTESLFSGSEMELSFLLSMEDRPQSPDSLPSNTRFRNLSPDSPVLDFRPHLLPAESDLSGHRSCSPELDFSDSEHVPLISDIFMFEDRAESCQSGLSGLECRALFLDSPIPYYPMPLHFEGPVKVRSTSPESLLSEEDLDHSDLSLEWLFDNRASSPDSAATKDELRALSPDSPVPQFTAGLQESFLSHSASRSTSTESLFSGSEMELSFLLSMEDRPQSPDSLPSNTRFRNLSPDSPVLDFRPHLLPAESDLSGHRSCSPELDFSDSEHVPLISDIFMFEDRAESCQSGLSGLECRALFLDSPIPYYPMPLHFEGPVKVRSTSPESLLSEEDLDHSDLSLEWLFDNRASSPDSAATKDELRALSPDSPVPQFTAGLQEFFLSQSASRSTSTESLFSGSEMELSFLLSMEDRPQSPDSLSSNTRFKNLSPDSPVLDFRLHMLRAESDLWSHRSCSPVDALLLTGHASHAFTESRPSSPESFLSVQQYPDSPLPDFVQPLFGNSVSTFESWSVSSESACSDIECTVLSLAPGFNDSRPSSPDSGADADKYNTVLPFSPIPRLIAAESEHDFINLWYRSPSIESLESDVEYSLSRSSMSLKSRVADRPDSPRSDGLKERVVQERRLSVHSIAECITMSPVTLKVLENIRSVSPESIPSLSKNTTLSPDSPLPGFVQNVYKTDSPERYYKSSSTESTIQLSDCDDLSQSLVPYCGDQRSVSPDCDEPVAAKSQTKETSYSTVMPLPNDSFSGDDSAATVAEHFLSGDARKLISQVCDPQYAGETFNRKTRIMQIYDSRLEFQRNVLHYEQNNNARRKEDNTATVTVTSSIQMPEPRPPMIEDNLDSEAVLYRQDIHSLEVLDLNMEIDNILVDPSVNTTDHLCRSTSPFPTTPESDTSNNKMNLESGDVEFPSSSTSSALSESEDLNERKRSSSLQSLLEYTPMSLEISIILDEERGSSPNSLSEFNENRSLSPDSPVPQFVPELVEYSSIPLSSSLESLRSDLEDEPLVTMSTFAEIDRPSSPESISSVIKFQRLLPDSPVPTFTWGSSCFMDGTSNDMSSSSVSLSSDSKFIAFPTDCWINDSPRPPSPESVESEQDLDFSHDSSDKLVGLVPCHERREYFSSDWQHIKESQLKNLPEDYSLAETKDLSRIQTTSFEEDRKQESSPHNCVKEERILDVSLGQLKKNPASRMATSGETDFQTEDDWQSVLLSARTPTPVLFPLDHALYCTHRTVTPVLPTNVGALRYPEWGLSLEEAQATKVFSPESAQSLLTLDEIFTEHQNLEVCDWIPTLVDEVSSVSPQFRDSNLAQVDTRTMSHWETFEDLEFSPGFKMEFETTLPQFEPNQPRISLKEQRKRSQSPQQSDSDLEFYECRQDFSEPDEMKLEPAIAYHVFEPASPTPKKNPDPSSVKSSFQAISQFEGYKSFSGSKPIDERLYGSEGSWESPTEGGLPLCEELPSRDQAGFYDDADDDFFEREIAEELLSDSSEEEVLTTRVVRRRVIIQGDDLPDIPPQTVTEEKYTDEHGNMVVKKITRKVIRKYVSPDGLETQEVTMEGSQQEALQMEEGDALSRVVKRTVIHSKGEQKELTCGSAKASEFEAEPVQGRKVSKVIKTTVVRGERTEKQSGDPLLSADLPSAREDFQKALGYAGGLGKVLLPHVLENESVQSDGSVLKRSRMHKSHTQKRTVVRDAHGTHLHLERLEDTPEALEPDALQQHLNTLLRRYCQDAQEDDEERREEEEEEGTD
ncbi:ankyrin-2 isoform X2 [Oryzias latipes]|uniref:ankyrin-2 isoform X2 n=1 Tax=Oryzias latipes TaxID=8090 RepID=UPI000CE2030F|nr:ankyrin-2 isoform X2 [Oryzias latipes]